MLFFGSTSFLLAALARYCGDSPKVATLFRHRIRHETSPGLYHLVSLIEFLMALGVLWSLGAYALNSLE